MKLPKNSIGAKQIKKNAVRSVEVKNNKLTGRDIRESKLGIVPSAQPRTLEAHHAGNADLLVGNPADAFARADRVVTARATARWDIDGIGDRADGAGADQGTVLAHVQLHVRREHEGHRPRDDHGAELELHLVGPGTIFGPASPPQTLVSATVPADDPNGDSATAGSPFSLYSPSDGTYLAGHVAVFATDDGQECRALLSGISG